MIDPAQIYEQLDSVRSRGAEPLDLLHPRSAYHQVPDDDWATLSDGFELESLNTAYDPDAECQRGANGALLFSTNTKLNKSYDWSEASSMRKLFAGWRLGATWASIFAIISLCINAGVLISIATSRHSNNGLTQVYTGSCDRVREMSLWVHLAINILSTVLLAGSNYCMQCLSSPTRKEIDEAHARARYLDIGILSARNVTSIAGYRQLMWWLLALSSIPLHLMYNSAFYGSLAVSDYDIFVAAPEDVAGVNFTTIPSSCQRTYSSIPAGLVKASNEVGGDFHRLEPLDCIKSYAQVLLTDRRNLIIVSDNATRSSNDSLKLLDHFRYDQHVVLSTQNYAPYDWLCTSDPQIRSKINVPTIKNPKAGAGDMQAPCDSYISELEGMVDRWTPFGYSFDHCLSEKIEETCSFNANIPIIAVVIACNVIKAVIMLIVAFGLGNTPLITIGDAIESFLNNPDPTTAGRCWLTRSHANTCEALWQPNNLKAWPKTSEKPEIHPEYISSVPRRWFSAASGWRWALPIALFIITIGTSFGLLGLSITAISLFGRSISQTGFGELQPTALVSGWLIADIEDPATRILASILVANTPQLILSFLYLNLNGLMTSMWVAAEWSDFVHERKFLRVSNPKGNQRSTHFLQLPYKIALPLMTVSGLLHWLISQSIFLAVVATYTCSGEVADPTFIATCGFSPEAILVTICVALVIPVAVVVIGCRRLPAGIPLAGSCSAAISAACHAPEWDVDASMRAVQYGSISSFDKVPGVGHCSFTSGEVHLPEKGKQYA